MENKLINIGYHNYISSERVIALIGPESAPIKRIIQEAREERRLIDATCGRRIRSVIVSDSDHVILSALQPETIVNRVEAFDSEEESELIDEEV